MRVSDTLSPKQVGISNESEGLIRSKAEALARLADLLANGLENADKNEIERVLLDREKLQSTGIGGGVAIPHGSLDRIDKQVGAMLLCPAPIDFDAIDNAPVSILFALIGPKQTTGLHLQTLARVSRLLRSANFREKLLISPDGLSAYAAISEEEEKAK